METILTLGVANDNGSMKSLESDVLDSQNENHQLIKAVPLKHSPRVQPQRMAEQLEAALGELNGCQTAAELQSVSAKIEALLQTQFGAQGQTKAELIDALFDAEATLKEDGQLVKSTRIEKIRKLLSKLSPSLKMKKQRKMLREVLKLSGKNLGVRIGNRGLCGYSVGCNIACLASSVIVAGTSTLVALLATGSGLSAKIEELENQMELPQESGNESTPHPAGPGVARTQGTQDDVDSLLTKLGELQNQLNGDDISPTEFEEIKSKMTEILTDQAGQEAELSEPPQLTPEERDQVLVAVRDKINDFYDNKDSFNGSNDQALGDWPEDDSIIRIAREYKSRGQDLEHGKNARNILWESVELEGKSKANKVFVTKVINAKLSRPIMGRYDIEPIELTKVNRYGHLNQWTLEHLEPGYFKNASKAREKLQEKMLDQDLIDGILRRILKIEFEKDDGAIDEIMSHI